MNVDPEVKRKTEDLKRPRDPQERDANEERRHLDEKTGEIIASAAAKKRSESESSAEAGEASESGGSQP